MPEVGNFTDADVEKYVRQLAAEEASKAVKGQEPKPEVTPEPKELVLNIGGQNMTFKDAEEAGKVLTSFYQQQLQQPPAKPQGQEVTNDQGARWTPEDQAKYVDLLTKNPIEAAEYVDSKRFGFDKPSERIKQTMINQFQTASQMAVDSFVKDHSEDYHVSPENLEVMRKTLISRGVNPDYGVTRDQLEDAFLRARYQGLLKEPEGQEQERYAPPVATRRNTSYEADASNYLADAENMSLEQLEKVLMKFQG